MRRTQKSSSPCVHPSLLSKGRMLMKREGSKNLLLLPRIRCCRQLLYSSVPPPRQWCRRRQRRRLSPKWLAAVVGVYREGSTMGAFSLVRSLLLLLGGEGRKSWKAGFWWRKEEEEEEEEEGGVVFEEEEGKLKCPHFPPFLLLLKANFSAKNRGERGDFPPRSLPLC